MVNYILLLETLGLPAGTIFVPTTDPTIYQANTNADINFLASTMAILPTYFEAEIEFTAADKLKGIDAAQIDMVTWDVAPSHYFSTYNEELDLWKVTAEDGDEWTVIKLSGNLTGLAENPTNIAKASFTDTRYQVFTPADEDSGSGSVSGI